MNTAIINTRSLKRVAVVATLAALTGGGVAIADVAPAASSPKTTHSTVWTPNDCIRVNHGDFNACNVGNSGGGDRPYLPVRGT